jgi:hypothetical protein
MADEAAIWQAHDEAAKDIFARLSKRLRGPEHPGMVGPEFLAELSRLEIATAGKLGRKREDLSDRFAPDEAKLKSKCGI